MSQWRGYAAKGGGYNLGLCFNSDTKYSNNSEDLTDDSYIILRKIIYDTKEQEEVITKYISSIVSASKNALSRFEKNGGIPEAWAHKAVGESINILPEILLSLKNKVFMEEKEWRLIKVRQGDCRLNQLKFRENNGKLIPYLDAFIYDYDDSDNSKKDKIFPLHSIRFGPMLDEISTSAAIELFVSKKSEEMNEIKIDASKIRIKGAGYILRE